MRYGKWHIEHITLPHAGRVGLDRLSAETQLISSLESRIVICLRVDVSQSAAEQRSSGAPLRSKPNKPRKGSSDSGFGEPNVGSQATW